MFERLHSILGGLPELRAVKDQKLLESLGLAEMDAIHALRLGIRRHPIKFVAHWFVAYSVIWTLIESITHFLPATKVTGTQYYGYLVLVSLLIACVRAYPPSQIRFKVPYSNTKITVSYGDVFERGGHIAIPVNEYFDSELGLPVSPKSLHGVVIDRFFGGHPASFDQLVSADLASVSGVRIERSGGKTHQYPIGTAASIRTSSHKFILFALCKTDIANFKASSSIPDFIKALECLCAKARIVLGGDKLVVPLAGSGLSGIGLPANQLLQLILLVLAYETKKNQFALELEIVIHHDRYDEIDLSVIESLWR